MSEITQLEDVRKRVNEAVKEHFGAAPTCDRYFDELVDEMRDLEFKVKTLYPEYYKTYQNKYY